MTKHKPSSITPMGEIRQELYSALDEAQEQITCLQERIKELESALERQADNMSFVLSHVGLPDQWFEKFGRELGEDRKALKEKPND